LQQVILNLLINAIEAMSEVNEGPRELWVSSQKFNKNPARGPHALQTRLWAKANVPRGAAFQFTLPLREERMS
jgi:hypothetical protein